MIEIYSDPASYVVVGRTLLRIFEGFVISMVVGTALGLLMGLKRGVEMFFDSWIMVMLTVPAVCWAFLSVLWFGISDAAPDPDHRPDRLPVRGDEHLGGHQGGRKGSDRDGDACSRPTAA